MFLLSRRSCQCRQPQQQHQQRYVLFSVEQFWGKRMMSSARRRRTTAAAAVVDDIDRRTQLVSLSSWNPCIIQDQHRHWRRPTDNLDMTNNGMNINNNISNHYNFTSKIRRYSSNSIAKEPVQGSDAPSEKDPAASTRSVVPQQQDRQQRHQQLQHQRQKKPNNSNNNNKKKKKSQWGRIVPYQDRARTILSQIEDGTIPPPLIPQKVELCLESFLQQYNTHNESSTSTSSSKTSSSPPSYYSSSSSSPLRPSDGPLARRLLDAVLTYRRRSLPPNNNHVDTMPRLFSLCCQIIVRSGHGPAIDRLPNLLEHVLLKGHETYFARDVTVTPHLNRVGSSTNPHDKHQANPREQQQQQQQTANTTTINKHGGGLAYNTHHVNDACKAYINHVVVTNEKLWKQQRHCQDYGRDDISSPNGNYNNNNNNNNNNNSNNKTSYNKQMQQIDRILKRLEQLYEDPNVPLMQSRHMSETIILLMCHQRRPYDAYRRLQWMVERALSSAAGNEQQDQDGRNQQGSTATTTDESLMPSVTSFTTTISGFAKIGDVEMARQVIQWMLSSNNDNRIPPPNCTCFNALLHAYAIKGGNDAGEKAEQTIRWMEQLRDVDGLDTSPDEISYNTVIDAFAKSRSPDAPVHAESILKNLITMHEQGLLDVPSEEAFTSTMNAWSSSRRDDATARVEALIDLMEALADERNFTIRNRDIAYSILIKTWETKASLSNNKSSQHKQRCADGILAVVARMKSKDIVPSSVTINAILTALSVTSPLNAIMYFLHLEQAFRNDNSSVDLSTKTFNSALNAIATLNRPDAMDRATEIFDRMIVYSSPVGKGTYDKQSANMSLRPSLATYNIILKIISRSSSPHAAEKADALLIEMDEQLHTISPDFISFLTTILAWGRSESMEKFQRVDDIIRRFAARFQQGGRPTRGSFSQPDIAVFNVALSVCSHNSNPDLVKASISTASFVISKMRQIKELKANETTYISFFAFVQSVHSFDSELISSDAALEELIRREFAACIRDGLVSHDILRMVQRTSPKLWKEATNNWNVDPDSETSYTIPNSWCRNVKPRGEKKSNIRS